jgi:hypothetical protein
MSSMQRAPETGANGASQQGELQQAASGLLDQAARTADAQASTTMTRVGDSLVSVAQAIDEAAGRLRETQPQVAGFVETAATKAEEAATYLREHDASEVLDTIQQTARRQPMLVVGGGLVAGLLLGRFLRTGATVAQGGRGGMTSGSGAYGATAYGSAAYGSTDYGSTDYGSRGYAGTGYGTTGATGATGMTGVATAYGATGYDDPATRLGGSDVSDELVATDEAVDADVIEVTGDSDAGRTR